MLNVFVFIAGMLVGGVFEIMVAFLRDLILKKPLRINHRFTFSKKLSLISLPIWGLLTLIIIRDISLVKLFVYASIIGTFLEFSLGKFFHIVFGVSVWTYKYGSLGRYTSIYSIPYWGGAGILLIMLARLSGSLI